MKEKPKYNMWQTTCFLFRSTWKHCKSLILFCVIYVGMHIFRRLLELYIAPTIVGQLESHVPLLSLIGTILFFTISIVITSWVSSFARREAYTAEGLLRLMIMDAINQKACRISYPETQDPKTIKLLENAMSLSNDDFTDLWDCLKETVINLASIIIYCSFLVQLEWWIPVIIVAAAVAGFYFNRYLNKWDYQHREERAACYTRMNYIVRKSEDFAIAKDIRIFGLQNWLQDIYNDSRNLLKAFLYKKERHDI